MKKILLCAALFGSITSASTARAQSTFPDVPDNHWAAQAVRRLAEAGIIEGLPATPAARRPVAAAPASNSNASHSNRVKIAARNAARAARLAARASSRTARALDARAVR